MEGKTSAKKTPYAISKKYGHRTAVNSINLSIKKGELFSLLGPNGAGKTTVIKMLSCLIKPTTGTAALMGHDINKSPLEIKQIINVSPQETAVAERLSSWENILLMGRVYGLSRKETEKRAQELIELVGLSERSREQVRKFSGGIQRRLSIAMALISDPKILFLDEPTLGLDPQSRKALWKEIENLKGQKTILLTTHYLEEADALADRVAIINEGSIVALGSPGELKDNLQGLQTMIIRAQHLTTEVVDGLKLIYPHTRMTENGIEIKANNLVFDDIVNYLRDNSVKIEWLSMKEPSLDDVFLSFAGKDEYK